MLKNINNNEKYTNLLVFLSELNATINKLINYLNSTFAENKRYYDAYKLSRMPYVSPEEHSTSGAYKIGNGEYLFFDKDSITLSIFNN